MLDLVRQFNASAKHVVIMCSPEFYAVKTEGHANDKERVYGEQYAADPASFRAKTMDQYKALKALYKGLGATVYEIAPTPGLGDQIYTADPAFTLINTKGGIDVLRSRFTNQSRQPEVTAFVEMVKAIAADQNSPVSGAAVTVREALNPVEGTGDAYYDPFRDVIFAGYTNNPDPNDPCSGRSSIDAHVEMEQLTGVEVVSLEVVEPCFHIDTCLTPLPSGHMLIYKAGMTDDAYNKLIQKAFVDRGLDPAEYAIHLSENDALNNFVTNLLHLGDKLIIPQFGDNGEEGVEPIDPALLQRLRDIGYEVFVHNVSQFIKAGGAMHCTSHVLMNRVPGGYITMQGATAQPAQTHEIA